MASEPGRDAEAATDEAWIGSRIARPEGSAERRSSVDATLEVIERALSAAQKELGLTVAYLTEFVGDSQIVRATYGDAAAFGLENGTTVALEGSYCQRLVDGRLPPVVPDTSRHAETRSLEVTAQAHLGAYVGVPVRFADGALYGTLCAASTTPEPALADRDVSFVNVLARMLADTIEEHRAHERMVRRLERASAAKSGFISRLSHELRTPLSALLVFAELLERDSPRPDQIERLRQIRQAGHHLIELLGETLDLASIEAGKLPVNMEDVAVEDAVQEAVGVLAPLAAQRGVALIVDGEDLGGICVRADRRRLHQCLLNLLTNAIKYGGGTAVVTGRRAGGDVEIAVADDGPGIPDGDLVALFAPFERLPAHRGQPEGCGLGLAVTKELLGIMGGSIDVSSANGHGTCFTMRLPRTSPRRRITSEDDNGRNAGHRPHHGRIRELADAGPGGRTHPRSGAL